LETSKADGKPCDDDDGQHLADTCSGFRRVRKDGNCFYRAFAFRLCELLVEHHGSQWQEEVLKKALGTQDILKQTGYDMELLIDFYEVFEQALKLGKDDTAELLSMFNTEYISDTIVCYLRLVTAAILKRDSFMYEAFVLDSFPSIQEFIATQVEPSKLLALLQFNSL
jgi:ubiquitin thioesterase protein OTUB1